MKALILVDLQYDFCPGGALEVKNGDEVIPVANQLSSKFDLVVATQDWHPADHGSFAANHPWRYPGQVIDLNGLEQILWPIHCVQNSFGAEFVKELDTANFAAVIQKGTDKGIDSYSGFFDNGHRKATGLHDLLQEKGVEEVYIMGLAQDYCVKFTVLDALELGYSVYLITDGTRPVNLNEGDGQKALDEMEEKGAILIESSQIV
jgi:nicotinamidase/pyrazinamidase